MNISKYTDNIGKTAFGKVKDGQIVKGRIIGVQISITSNRGSANHGRLMPPSIRYTIRTGGVKDYTVSDNDIVYDKSKLYTIID